MVKQDHQEAVIDLPKGSPHACAEEGDSTRGRTGLPAIRIDSSSSSGLFSMLATSGLEFINCDSAVRSSARKLMRE